ARRARPRRDRSDRGRAATTRRPSRDALELLEAPDVALDEQPHVSDPVPHHRDALDPETEREARVSLGIDPAVLEDLRVHHPGAEQLEPPVAADAAAQAGAGETTRGAHA